MQKSNEYKPRGGPSELEYVDNIKTPLNCNLIYNIDFIHTIKIEVKNGNPAQTSFHLGSQVA